MFLLFNLIKKLAFYLILFKGKYDARHPYGLSASWHIRNSSPINFRHQPISSKLSIRSFIVIGIYRCIKRYPGNKRISVRIYGNLTTITFSWNVRTYKPNIRFKKYNNHFKNNRRYCFKYHLNNRRWSSGLDY